MLGWMEADDTKAEMWEKIVARWRRRWAGKNTAGMLGDDSAAYATVVIGSHHRAAIFAASPPGSIQAVSAPVTTHQVEGEGGGGR